MGILELDIGNTRGKWRLLEEGEAVARGVFATGELRSGQLPQALRQLRPTRVRAANVAGPEVAAGLGSALRDSQSSAVEFALVRGECGGVICGYRDPAQLGVDRWLAVLAAHRRDPAPALVVDCGSAITLDLLGTGGQHLGGYILPGLGPMRRALYSDTDAVKVPDTLAPGMSLGPGRDTLEAVNRGLPLAVLGAADRALEHLRQAAGVEPLLWLTGGDGELVSSLCPWAHQLLPELVLDGLALSNP